MNDTASVEPAIVGALNRARNLRDQIASAVIEAGIIANRVAGSLPPEPIEATDKRVYNDSLYDAFLSVHDNIEAELVELKKALGRIASQV